MRPRSCLLCASCFIQSHPFPSAFAVRFFSSSRKLPGRVATWQLFSKNKKDQFLVNRSKQQIKAEAKAERRRAQKAQAVTIRGKESWDVNESSSAQTGAKQWVPKQAAVSTEAKHEDKLNSVRVVDGPWSIWKNEMKQQKPPRTPLAEPSAAHVPLLLFKATSTC